MINHARNLLMNVDGSPGFLGYIGEEIVDPTYSAWTVSNSLGNIRRVLFGANPDREMLNYRCRQYMSLLHSNELQEFVTDLDPRITYNFNDNPFADNGLYEMAYVQLGNATGVPVTVGGDIASPDVTGKLSRSWQVSLVNSGGYFLRVTGAGFPATDLDVTVDLTGKTTSAIQLPLSDLGLKLTGDVSTESYRIMKRRRPTVDLGSIVASLESIGSDVMSDLFSTATPAGSMEPMKTFQQLWQHHHELAFRLGAVLLALIYQTGNE